MLSGNGIDALSSIVDSGFSIRLLKVKGTRLEKRPQKYVGPDDCASDAIMAGEIKELFVQHKQAEELRRQEEEVAAAAAQAAAIAQQRQQQEVEAVAAAAAAAAAAQAAEQPIRPLVADLRTGNECQYHFFVSKHEQYIADKLRVQGFNVWLSQWQQEAGEDIDKEGMHRGIEQSAAVILLLTPGIFHRDQIYVTDYELQHAIDHGKPIIPIESFSWNWEKCGGFDRHSGDEVHLRQTCDGVYPAFQPYARAITKEAIHKWSADSRRLALTSKTSSSRLRSVSQWPTSIRSSRVPRRSE